VQRRAPAPPDEARIEKNPRPVSRRGLLNSCDDDNMPVICPTCQNFLTRLQIYPPALLFKSLNRWRRGSLGGKRRGPDRWRRTCRGDRLSLRCRTGLRRMPCPGPRWGSLHSPGARNRRPGGVSDERTRHRADGSQHDGARHRTQRGTSGPLLCPCLEREKRSCDQCAHEQSLHRDFLEPSTGHRTAKLRR
jgi:hypothetical protein